MNSTPPEVLLFAPTAMPFIFLIVLVEKKNCWPAVFISCVSSSATDLVFGKYNP